MTFSLPIYQGLLKVPTVVFFTIISGRTPEEVDEERNFLCASLDHHSQMGSHYIIDTTPRKLFTKPGRIPKTVVWSHRPDMDKIHAFDNGIIAARGARRNVIVYVEPDEFFTADSMKKVFAEAQYSIIETQRIEWDINDKPTLSNTWIRSAWPSKPDFDKYPVKKITGHYHNCIRSAISGTSLPKEGRSPDYARIEWPERAILWKRKNIRPLDSFQ
jgi:hypothetical protein